MHKTLQLYFPPCGFRLSGPPACTHPHTRSLSSDSRTLWRSRRNAKGARGCDVCINAYAWRRAGSVFTVLLLFFDAFRIAVSLSSARHKTVCSPTGGCGGRRRACEIWKDKYRTAGASKLISAACSPNRELLYSPWLICIKDCHAGDCERFAQSVRRLITARLNHVKSQRADIHASQ